MRYVDYDEAIATLSPAAAVDALREELTGGFDCERPGTAEGGAPPR